MATSEGGGANGETRFRVIGQEEFARRLRRAVESGDAFAWLLGAGCSVSSGVPAAADCARTWLREVRYLESGQQRDVVEWAKLRFEGFDETDFASVYVDAFTALFFSEKEKRQALIALSADKTPGAGYRALARLVRRPPWSERLGLVLTTNFDGLAAAALGDADAAVAAEAPATDEPLSAPAVVALQTDAHQTADGLSASDDAAKRLRAAIGARGLILLGYGGRDETVLDLLEGATPRGEAPMVYWANPEEPSGRMADWITARGGVWVRIKDFDGLMGLVDEAFGGDAAPQEKPPEASESTPESRAARRDRLRRSIEALGDVARRAKARSDTTERRPTMRDMPPEPPAAADATAPESVRSPTLAIPTAPKRAPKPPDPIDLLIEETNSDAVERAQQRLGAALRHVRQRAGFREQGEATSPEEAGADGLAAPSAAADGAAGSEEAQISPAAEPVSHASRIPLRADATAEAPRRFSAGETSRVRISVHPVEQSGLQAAFRGERDTSAAGAEPTAAARDELADGDRIALAVRARGATIDAPPSAQVWRGEPLAFEFGVAPETDARSVVISAALIINGVAIGRIAFSRSVAGVFGVRDVVAQLTRPRLARFRRAYFSCASDDREQAQAIAAQYQHFGVAYIEETLLIEPGERWRLDLYEDIERCDLFVLFWSAASARSEPVLLEAERAWRRYARTGGASPTLLPAILDPSAPGPTPEQDWLTAFRLDDPHYRLR